MGTPSKTNPNGAPKCIRFCVPLQNGPSSSSRPRASQRRAEMVGLQFRPTGYRIKRRYWYSVLKVLYNIFGLGQNCSAYLGSGDRESLRVAHFAMYAILKDCTHGKKRPCVRHPDRPSERIRNSRAGCHPAGYLAVGECAE